MAMIKEHVRLDGLLLSSDAQVLAVMNPILDTFALKTEVCGELDSTLDAVTHRRLDTVIVDWDGVHNPNRALQTWLASELTKLENAEMPADAVMENAH